jgi:ankyrin repeat protein
MKKFFKFYVMETSEFAKFEEFNDLTHKSQSDISDLKDSNSTNLKNTFVNFNDVTKEQKFKQFLENNLDKLVKCPITYCICNDPVVADDGFIYESTALEKLLSVSNKSPVTRQEISKKYMEINLVRQIIEFLENSDLELFEDRYVIGNSFEENFDIICTILTSSKKYEFIKRIKQFQLGKIDINGRTFCELMLSSLHKNKEQDKEHIETIKYIFDNSTDLRELNYHGMNIFHSFFKFCKNSELFQHLLNYHWNDLQTYMTSNDLMGNTPIYYAFYSGDTEKIKIVLSLKIDIDSSAFLSYVNIAISTCSDDDLVISLIDRLKDINCHDEQNLSPLFRAIKFHKMKIIEHLLSRGADLEYCPSPAANIRAIHYACMNDHSNITKYIIDRTPDLEIETNEGWRPIHSACYYSSSETISYLLTKNITLTAPIKKFNDENKEYLPINLLELNATLSNNQFESLLNQVIVLMGM